MSQIDSARMDAEDLARLATFHKVFAYFIGIGSLCGCPHLVIGLFLMVYPPSTSSGGAFEAFMGFPFMIAGLVVIVGFATLCYYNFKVVEAIELRSNPNLITIVSACNLLAQPFGTALGIYSLITMNRPSVRLLFNPSLGATLSMQNENPTPPPSQHESAQDIWSHSQSASQISHPIAQKKSSGVFTAQSLLQG